MKSKKINLENVKKACKADNSIRTITGLAHWVPCSRPAIYFALERPARFPMVYGRLRELVSKEGK